MRQDTKSPKSDKGHNFLDIWVKINDFQIALRGLGLFDHGEFFENSKA